MLKHIYLVLIATFFFGFVAGFILWIFNNTGAEAVDDSPTVVDKGLSITAQQYGGCEFGGACSSYRIDDDGNFTYITRGRNTPDLRNEGELTKADFSRIEGLVSRTNFESISNSPFTGTCPIAYDGMGYRYTVEYKGKFYSFDSCREDLEGERLFEDLNVLFEVLRGERPN